MSNQIIKCHECGFDFRDNQLISAYKYQGKIYCEDCLRPIEEVVYFEMDSEDFIETEQVEEIYLEDGKIV